MHRPFSFVVHAIILRSGSMTSKKLKEIKTIIKCVYAPRKCRIDSHEILWFCKQNNLFSCCIKSFRPRSIQLLEHGIIWLADAVVCFEWNMCIFERNFETKMSGYSSSFITVYDNREMNWLQWLHVNH